MKKFFAIPLLLACLCVSQAAVLKVASNGTQAYTDITDAIAASSSGDTILVMAGGYTGFTVPHRLVIIGSGTGTGIGEGSLVNGLVSVEEAADSTELRSLWIVANVASGSVDSLATVVRIHSGADKVFIWRCLIENYATAGGAGFVFLGESTNTEISQCVFWSSVDLDGTGQKGILQRGMSSMTRVNRDYQRGRSHCEVRFERRRFGNRIALSVHGQKLQHISLPNRRHGNPRELRVLHKFRSDFLHRGAGVTYSYCAYSAGEAAPPGATHVECDSTSFLNMNVENFRSADYHLAPGSVLEDAGNPGSPFDLNGSSADIGLFGGQHPYVEDGVPDYPFAVQVEVPYSAPLNGTMRIWGRGRVGPGN